MPTVTVEGIEYRRVILQGFYTGFIFWKYVPVNKDPTIGSISNQIIYKVLWYPETDEEAVEKCAEFQRTKGDMLPYMPNRYNKS